MKQRTLLTISMMIILLLGFSPCLKTLGQTQIFVGPPTQRNSYFETDSFFCSEVCQISWEASHYGISASFYFYAFQVGTPLQRQARFYGVLGMTYFYATGEFYFQVYAHAGIRSWHILVDSLNFERLEPHTSFLSRTYGDREINTEIFVCSEHCTITWTTDYDASRVYAPANFTISIIGLGQQDPVKVIAGYCTEPSKCYDMDGTISLMDNGTFYFRVATHQINEWEISVEAVPLVPEGNYFHALIWVGGHLGWILVIIAVKHSLKRHSRY